MKHEVCRSEALSTLALTKEVAISLMQGFGRLVSKVRAFTHGPAATHSKANGRMANVTDWAWRRKANGYTEVRKCVHDEKDASLLYKVHVPLASL